MFRLHSISRPRVILFAVPLMIGAVIVFAMVGCGDDDTTAPGGESVTPTVVFLDHGNCKTAGAKSAPDTASTEWDRVEYSLSGDTLHFDHINTAFNCCVDSIYVELAIVGDTLRIQEIEALRNPGGCRCVCLYDISWEIVGIESGNYYIDIRQLYLNETDETHLFAINTMNEPSGGHELIRSHDPWGQPRAEPTVELVSRTDCKTFEKQIDAPADSGREDCIDYSYDGSGTLYLIHTNTGFNCCVDSLPVTISISNDTVQIVEDEILENDGCDCLCLYDLEYRVENLPPGAYVLEIYQQYIGGGAGMHQYVVELYEAVSDERCIVRTQYPWDVGF